MASYIFGARDKPRFFTVITEIVSFTGHLVARHGHLEIDLWCLERDEHGALKSQCIFGYQTLFEMVTVSIPSEW